MASDTLRVFISYARKDAQAFAEELVAGLELTGFEAFLDKHDIAGGEDWEARLGGLIESADTVVFVLTPASVDSPRCQWEVERALGLSKRIIPVVLIPIEEAQTPAPLKRLNYIFFTPDKSFSRSLAELSTALRVDLGWIREHTRLGEHARRWHEKGRSDVSLLRGGELHAAQAWMAQWRAPAPEPTDLHRALIAASETAEGVLIASERARLRSRAQLAILAIIVLAALTATSSALWFLSEQRLREVQAAQVEIKESREQILAREEQLAAFAHFQQMQDLSHQRDTLRSAISMHLQSQPGSHLVLPRYSAYQQPRPWQAQAEAALREEVEALHLELDRVQRYRPPAAQLPTEPD